MISRKIREFASAGDIDGLRRIYEENESRSRVRQKVIERVRVIFNEDSTALLAKIASDDSDEVLRGTALTWLVDPKRDALELVQVSGDRSRVALSALARGLSKNDSDDSIRMLGALVSQTEPNVRWPALESLRKLGGPRVTAAVAPALNDSEMVVRLLAAEVLAETGDPRSLELLERSAQAESGMGEPAMRKSLDRARELVDRQDM